MSGVPYNSVAEADATPRGRGIVGLVRQIASGSLTRNGYSLIVNVATTSALGFFFWLIAARLYPVDVVGENAELMAVLMTICVIAQLNLGSVLTRFLPILGRKDAARGITGAYAVSTAATIIGAIGALAVTYLLIPSLQRATLTVPFALWFVLACVAWNILALQEGALAGLRSAIWIPLQNTIGGLAKITLLLGFAGAALFTEFGPFVAWTAPVAVTAIVVNILIFTRLIASRQADNIATPPTLKTISRYLGGDYVGQVFFSATFSLSSVLVVQFVGAAANAAFYVTLTMAYALYLMSKSMTVSLVAEAAADEQQLRTLTVRALKHALALVSLGAATLFVIAPFILGLYGPSYADEGTIQLRLLAVSAIPFVFIAIALGVARVQGRMVFVALVQAALMVLVLGLAVPLMDMVGVAGMALSWLIAQCIVAPVVTVMTVRRLGWRRQT